MIGIGSNLGLIRDAYLLTIPPQAPLFDVDNKYSVSFLEDIRLSPVIIPSIVWDRIYDSMQSLDMAGPASSPNSDEELRGTMREVDSQNMPIEHDFANTTRPSLSRKETSSRTVHDTESDTDSTATSTEEEFNWDEEETPVEQNTEIRAKRGRRLWLALMKLSRPVRVLLIASIGVAILITPLLVVNIRFNSSPVKHQVHIWSLWLTIIWATSCATYILVDTIPKIIIFVTGLFGANVERLKIQVELTMAVKSWLKLLLCITWAWISLSIIRKIYNPPESYWTIINRVITAFFVAGIALFVEKLFLQFVAINFHEKAVADRLAENQLSLRALDRLSNAQTIASIKKSPYFKRGHKSTGSTGTFDYNSTPTRTQKEADYSPETQPMNERHESPTFSPKPGKLPKRKKKLMTSVIVDQVGGVIGQVALKNSKFNKQGDFSGLHSARKLARKLFGTLSNVDPSRSHLIVDDFYPYFRTSVEAHEAFALFDKDGNGDISKKEMREAVQRIYRERKALIGSLKDVSSIVAKLDAVLLCITFIVIIFLCLLIFSRTNTIASLVPLATIVLGFSFVFGNSAATLFESLIFIFSTHVFDVGDLVMIDDQVLFVKEFGLFATTFRRVDGQEIIAPNSLLSSTKLVHNLRRSKSMWDSTQLIVSYDTSMEVIEQLRFKIATYISTNSREWSDCSLNIDKMEYQNAIYLNIGMEHRPNWQDWGGRWIRRTAFMRNLKTILEELDIRYTMPVQPVLLPQGKPSHVLQGSRLQDSLPGHGRRSTPETETSAGNAGFFQAGEYGRASSPLFQEGVPSF